MWLKNKIQNNIIRQRKSIYDGVKLDCNQCDYKAIKQGSSIKYDNSIHNMTMFYFDLCEFRTTR